MQTMATFPGALGRGSTQATSDSFPPEVAFNVKAADALSAVGKVQRIARIHSENSTPATNDSVPEESEVERTRRSS